MRHSKSVYIRRRIVVAILLLSAIFTFTKVIFAEPASECRVKSVSAKSGDTLWDLAEEYCNGPTGIIVERMISLNGTDFLPIGKEVRFPQD